MLKRATRAESSKRLWPAAFGRLCVKTAKQMMAAKREGNQPPSGGCVLKRMSDNGLPQQIQPAAFGRLCVETSPVGIPAHKNSPAAFGRLCVETVITCSIWYLTQPAAFGRLCVETGAERRVSGF